MSTISDPFSKKRRRVRLFGGLTLLAGLGSATLVYQIRTRSQVVADDPSTVGFNQPQRRQMALLYGNMGLMVEDLTEDLKRPGTQAAMILGASGLVAAGCFYFSNRLDGLDDGADDPPPPGGE